VADHGGSSAAIGTSRAPTFGSATFHDRLLSYGSLPLSVIEWLMFDDPSTLAAVTGER